MKTITMRAGFFSLLLSLLIVSCTDELGPNDNDPNPNNPNPPGELALFAIDTAKINTLTITGTNETTIINRMENLNSYFGDLSISPDGEKLAYTNYQASGTVPDMVVTRELRVANADGTADHAVYTSNEAGINIASVRYCSDGKIFFMVETFFPDATRTLHLVNADGTGLETITGQYNLVDISNDRNYYLLNPSMGANGAAVAIIDRNGDGGAGGLYHNEDFDGIDEFAVGRGVFTKDGKLAVIPYKDGSAIKARVVNMETKASATNILVEGVSDNWINFHLDMAADSNRGIITLTGMDYAKSKSYVFNLTTGDVAVPFENNDAHVRVYVK